MCIHSSWTNGHHLLNILTKLILYWGHQIQGERVNHEQWVLFDDSEFYQLLGYWDEEMKLKCWAKKKWLFNLHLKRKCMKYNGSLRCILYRSKLYCILRPIWNLWTRSQCPGSNWFYKWIFIMLDLVICQVQNNINKLGLQCHTRVWL